MDSGWIKIHRRILDWEWYDDIATFKVFMHLLLTANHQDKQWRGVSVKRGQLITGRKALSEELGLSERKIRTSLKRLKSTSEVTIKTCSKYSLITVNSYNDYQLNDQQDDHQTTSKRPQLKKERKKEEKKNTEEKIKKENQFSEFWNQYPKKIKKIEAERKFMKLKDGDIDLIFKALPVHKASEQWSNPQYIPAPSAWLNGMRWLDEVQEESVSMRKNPVMYD